MIGVSLILAAALAFNAPANRCEITRDDEGRIARDRDTVQEFKRLHPPKPQCRGTFIYVSPKTGKVSRQPRCVVDHYCALRCGGCDEVANMQWQEWYDSKAKDRWEGTPSGCLKTCGFAPDKK